MAKVKVIARYEHPKFNRLQVQQRSNSRFLQAWTRIDGKPRQASMKTTDVPLGLKLAEDWYKREVRSSFKQGMQHPVKQLTHDPTMAELFASYRGTLNPKKEVYAKQKWNPIADFWRARTLSTVSAQMFREFFTWRRSNNDRVEQVKNHTLHKDVMLIRQVLKHAIEQDLLERLPIIPKVGKIEDNPRPWFTEQEWRHLWTVSKTRIVDAPTKRTKQQRQDLHDLIVFMYHATCRVGEIVKSLRFRDCRVEKNTDGQKMLIAEVNGKTGVRSVVMTFGAASVYERRIKTTPDPKTDYIFPTKPKDGFAELLEAAGLRTNNEGFMRNLKSMRSSSISQRMLNQPDLNQTFIARNSGVSVNTIDKFYAKRLTSVMQKNALSLVATKKGKKDRADDLV